MSREKLAEKIMLQCAHDGEPVTYEDALEMADYELKAKGVKNYTESEDFTEKIAKKTRKRNISDEKKQIFNDLNAFLIEKYDFIILTPYKKVEISLNGKTFTLDLIEKRSKVDENG